MSTVILTSLISIAFMMRNTSPVGWLPLLAIKVLREGAFLPFLISGIFVALPIIFGCIYIDTKVYGSDKWVITGYNFLEMNLIHGLSKYFGESGPFFYLIGATPSIFASLMFLAIISPFSHMKTQWHLNKTPYIAYYTVFYMVFFSLIAHKEIRFMLPVIPFLIICCGELAVYIMKAKPTLVAFFVKVYISTEIITWCVFHT